jgi:branched-chain amino acid transport system substrate-binding protein
MDFAGLDGEVDVVERVRLGRPARSVLMVGLPEWRNLATPEALAALQAARVEPDGYVVQAFAAFQVALQAGGVGLAAEEALSRLTFPTAIGDVRFDDKGDLARPLYRLFRYDGERFAEVE